MKIKIGKPYKHKNTYYTNYSKNNLLYLISGMFAVFSRANTKGAVPYMMLYNTYRTALRLFVHGCDAPAATHTYLS